jgi:hypothetical protein
LWCGAAAKQRGQHECYCCDPGHRIGSLVLFCNVRQDMTPTVVAPP